MSSLLSQASLVMIPSGYKEDVVYSQIPTNGNGDLSFTRASNGTRINSAGLVEVCPWNLLQQSENIGTSPWLTNGATLTSGQTDPSGGTTAVKVELASGGNNYVYQGILLPNPINVVSAYLRADSATTIGFSMGGSTPNAVNLTTTWQLFTFSSGDTSGGIIFDNYFGPSPTQQAKTFYIWHPQFNIGSTAKPYFPTTDRLNVPRLTYQNGGGGCPSLLLEKQSTNLFTYSEQFDNADWTKLNTTVSANSVTSPDGTQNADTLTPTTTNGAHRVEQDKATATQVFTQSIFAKANGYNFIALENGGEVAYFNISTGVVGTVSAGTASIQNMGNGWYRCIFTATALNTKSYFYVASVDNSVSFAGNGTSGIYVWGAQFEQSSYATSLILTTSSSATRVADACFKTGISSLIGQTEGTLFFQIERKSGDSAEPIWLSDGSYANYIYFVVDNTQVRFIGVNASGTQWNMSTTALSQGMHKIAGAYKANDIIFYIDGVQIATDTNAQIPTCSFLGLGYENTVAYNNGDPYNQVALFPTRLTNAELASLTTL